MITSTIGGDVDDDQDGDSDKEQQRQLRQNAARWGKDFFQHNLASCCADVRR